MPMYVWTVRCLCYIYLLQTSVVFDFVCGFVNNKQFQIYVVKTIKIIWDSFWVIGINLQKWWETNEQDLIESIENKYLMEERNFGLFLF